MPAIMILQESQYNQEFSRKKKDRKQKGRNIRIDYGLSNRMMISAVIQMFFFRRRVYGISNY